MPGTAFWIVASMLVHGGIALVLLAIMGRIRVPMVASGKMRIEAIALSREPWPAHEKRVSNAFDNQFQLPVLFYVACGLALYFGGTVFEAVLAVLFVLSRIVHAAVFAYNNDVGRRFVAYTIGATLLGIFWLDLAIRLLARAGSM